MAGHRGERHLATLLVVDDERDIRDSVRAVVENLVPDVRVLVASSGAEALEVLRTAQVDLVLTDYKMPGMDGVALLVEVGRRYPGTRRMLITAYLEPDILNRALGEGRAAHVVPKPPDPITLAGLVEETLSASDAG